MKTYSGEEAKRLLGELPGAEEKTAVQFIDSMDPVILIGTVPLEDGESRNFLVVKGGEEDLVGMLVGLFELLDWGIVQRAALNVIAAELLNVRLKEMAEEVVATD